VQGMFNSIASKYDFMNSLMSLGLDKKWRKELVAQLGNIDGKYGVDFCCGTGKLTIALAHTVGNNGQMTGLDFSEGMLAIARQDVCPKNKSIKFVQGNAISSPFNNDSFDFATVAWGLRNVRDISQALSEMVRVVKSGGTVVSIDMAQPEQPMLRKLYWFLFATIIPLMGRIIASNKNAYGYLYNSVREFPKQEKLSQMFRDAGLVNVSCQNLSGGIVAIIRGQKP